MKYTPHSTDTELIKGARKKDRLAQKYLYQRYYGKMMGIAMRYAGSQAEAGEILNSAFLKVFNGIEKYRQRQQSSFGAWVATIVTHTAIDHVRKHTNYRNRMDFNAVKELHISNTALDKLVVEDIFKLIQKLPKASRTVFSMYVIDGFKHREIAQKLDISEGTSKWHLSNAKKELQTMLSVQQKHLKAI